METPKGFGVLGSDPCETVNVEVGLSMDLLEELPRVSQCETVDLGIRIVTDLEKLTKQEISNIHVSLWDEG